MAAFSTGAPIVKVYHDKSMILPDVSRVLACLYEKDIKFERHTPSSYKSLLKLQASNHAPVPFYDRPTFLEESREICHYIAETYEHHGYPFLLGKDSLQRASIEQWLHHEEHAFNPPSRSLFCHLAFRSDEEDDDIDLQKRKLEEVLEVYEQRLSDSEFLAGNKFTLADLVHLPNSHYITASDKFVYLYDSRKNVQRWWNAISTRDSWKKVLKDIKKVEQQRQQDEFEKQPQQQWQREHPTTTRRQIRLDHRKHTSTKSQTILVPPPVGIISTSPMAPQAEKSLPSEILPDETPTSSRKSTPTSHKSSAVQSKQATIFTTHIDTPQASVGSTPRTPEKSPVSSQRKINFFTPLTSPATADKPPKIDADNSRIRDVSVPSEATEADLPTKSKPSSSKEVSTNLHVFDFYKASSHIDEGSPYIEPAPQETSEMFDRFSETDGPSDATVQAKTSSRSTNEDPDQLSESKSADSQDKESVRYTDRTPQRPEIIYGRYNTQRGTDTFPGKFPSTEAHQELKAEQWHAATTGLTNLEKETDHIRPTQQVKPKEDVQQHSLQDSERPSTHPSAQDPVSMDEQLAQGPEMTNRTPHTDQRRDVSSVLWQRAADIRGIAKEDEASSDHRGAVLPPYKKTHDEAPKIVHADRRKDASLQRRVKDDDAHDTTQEAGEIASASRQTRSEAHDAFVETGTYHSVPPRSQPTTASYDAAPPPKEAAFKGPRRATTPIPGAQDLIKEARESPASRPTVPHDAQGSTDGEETVKSSSSEVQLLDSRLADSFPPKQFLDEDSYGAVPPLQTGYTDDRHNKKQGRDPAASRRMVAQDAHVTFEETKMAAETLDYRQADALPQKQPPPKDPRTTTPPFQNRYFGDEDAAKQPRSRKMAAQEVQDNSEETKAGDSWSFREQPSDTRQAPGPLPRHAVDDARSTTTPFREKHPYSGGTTKEAEDITSMPQRTAGEDAKGTFEVTKFAESASSRDQPLDYQRTDDPSRKQEAIEHPFGATSPLGKRYADVEGTTKHSRDTSFKPKKMEGQDVQDASEEADARNSLIAQHLDAWRVATTPSNQSGAEDALSMSQSPQTRYSRAEETSKQPRAVAPTPTHIAAQDARDALRESKIADSPSSVKQPSDARDAAPLPNKKVHDAQRYPDTEGNSKEGKDTFEETKNLDSASSQVQPLKSQRADAQSRKKEATEDPHRASSPFRKGHSDVEDTTKQSRENDFKKGQIVDHDAQGTQVETKAGDFVLPRDQPSDTWQAAATPTEKKGTRDGSRLTPPSEKRSPTNEETIKQPRGAVSTPRRITAEDENNKFQTSKHTDSVSSRKQSLSAWQPSVTPPRQETEDSHSTTAASQKTYPYEGRTKQASDTAFVPRKIGAEDTKYTSKDTKFADSASPSAKPTYTPRVALPLSDQEKIEEPARDKGGESRKTISAPKKMVSRESFVDETKNSQDFKGTTKKSESTLQGPSSILPTTQSLGAQDAQCTNGSFRTPTGEQWKDVSRQLQSDVQDIYKQPISSSGHQKGLGSSLSQAEAGNEDQAIRGDKIFSDSQVTSSKIQPTDSQGPIKVNRMPSVYQEDPLVAQDYLEQAQTLSTGEKADGSTPKHRQGPVVPSTSEEKSTASAPPRAKVHDGHSAEEPSKRGTVVDRKEARPLLVEKPTSQVQRGTEMLQAVDDGDTSSKLSAIDQWWRATTPLQDVTPNSGDSELSVSSIDQKPTPMSQKENLSAQGANEMIKSSPGKKVEQPAPTGAQTSDGKHAPPSLSGAARGERSGELAQNQAPTLTAGSRAAPDTREAGGEEFANTSDGQISKTLNVTHDSAVIHGDIRDTNLSTNDDIADSKTATSNANEAQGSGTWPNSTPAPVNARLATDDEFRRFLHDKGAQPPESAQAQTPLEARSDSTSTQNVPSDVLQVTKFSKLTSTEGIVPTAEPTSTLETQLDGPLQTEADHPEHKLAPSDKRTARASEPLSSVELQSLKEDGSVSAADQTKTPQTIFRQQTRPPAPATREVPSADTRRDMKKVQEVTLDNLITNDSAKPYGRPTSGDKAGMLPGKGAESPTSTQAKNSEDLRNSASTQDIPADVFGNFKKRVPHSTEQEAISFTPDQASDVDAQPDHATGEVSPAAKKFAPSEPFSAVESRKEESTVAEAKQSKLSRPIIGQQDIQHVPEISEPLLDDDHIKESVSGTLEAQDAAPVRTEADHAEHKFTPSDKRTAHAAQPLSSVKLESIKEDNSVSAANQTKSPQTIFRQQARPLAPIIKEDPFSDTQHGTRQIKGLTLDNRPADASAKPLVPSHEQVSHAPTAEPASTLETQLAASSRGEADHPEHKLAPSADPTKTPQTLFRQQTRPPAPITREVPSADTRHDTKKIQEVTLDDIITDDSPTPYVLPTSVDKPGILPGKGPESPTAAEATNSEDLRNSASTQDIPANAFGNFKKLGTHSTEQEAISSTPDQASDLDARPDYATGEVSPAAKKLAPSDQDSVNSVKQPSSVETRKEKTIVAAAEQTLPPAIGQQDTRGWREDTASDIQHSLPEQKFAPSDQDLTHTSQLPSSTERINEEIKDSARSSQHGNFQDVAPDAAHHIDKSIEQEAISSIPGQATDLDTQLDSATGEVLPAAKKFVPSDQDSVNSARRPSLAETRKEETVISARVIGQQDTQGMREAPTSDTQHALPGQKFATSVDSSLFINKLDQDSAHSTQRASSAEPINEEIKDSARSAEPLFSALPDQTKKSTTVGQQDISPAPGTSESPSSEPLSLVESSKQESQPIIGQQDTRNAPGISEPMLDDDRNKKSVSRIFEPHKVSPPDVQDAKRINTLGQAKISDPRHDLLPASVDVDPSSGHKSTPDTREAGEQEFFNTSNGQISKASKATHDSAVIHEDVRDTSLSTNDDIADSKTVTSNANEAQGSGTWPDSTPAPLNVRLATDDDFRRFLRDKGAQPPESAQAQIPLEDRSDSASTSNVPSDVLKITKFGKPTSTEGIAPAAEPASTLDTQLAAPLQAEADHPENKFAPSEKRTARAAESLSSVELESLKEDASVSADDQTKTPQTIFRQQAPPAPITREVPSADSWRDMKKIQEDTLDNLIINDSAKPYVHPTSGDKPGILPGKGPELPTTTKATNSKDLRNSASTQDIPADVFGNFKKRGPHLTEQEAISSTPDQASDVDAQPDHATGEVSPAAKKFAPSDQDSFNSVKQPSSIEVRKDKTIVAATEETLPTAIGQQDTRGMREAPNSGIQHSLPAQKFAPSDQDLAHTTQLPSSTERMNEEIKDSARSSQPLNSVVPDQIKKTTTIGQQDISHAPGISKSPSSGAHHAPGKFQDVAPDAHHIDKSIPSQGKVSRLKPDFEPSEGPNHDVHSAINEKTMRPPPSQAQSSDSKPDSTQNNNDERSTGFVPNQMAQRHEETPAPTLPMGLNDSNLAQGVPTGVLGKVKSLESPLIDQEAMAPRVASDLTPGTDLSTVPEEVDPMRQKSFLKDQGSAQSAQKSISSEPTKEQSTVVALDQVKTSETMFAQPDIALPPALDNTRGPSSDSQPASQKIQEINPEVHRIDGPIPIPSQEQVPHKGPTPDPNSAIVQEPNTHTTWSKSAPRTQQDMVQGGISSDEKKFEVSDQDSDRGSQTPASAESTEEETYVTASDQNMAQQTTFGRQAIMPAPGTDEASGEVLEVSPGDHQSSELTKPPIGQKQDSHDGHSELYEGPTPDVSGVVVGEKTPPPLVSQIHNVEVGSNSSADGAYNPSSGDEPVTELRREQEMQPAPAFEASVPSKASADAFGKVEPLKATGEVTPADQSIAPSEPFSPIESRKEESTFAEAKQSKSSQLIIDQQDIRHVPEISEPLLDNDLSKESVSGKEQVSHNQRTSEPREASTLNVQHAAPTPTEADHDEHKFTPSDKRTAHAAQPLSSVKLESIKEDNSVSAADQTKSPQIIFRQQAIPLAPITKEDPSSDTQHGTRKIEGLTLDNPTDDLAKSLVPSHEQVSHAPQTLSGKKDKTPVPGTRDSLAPNTQLDGLTLPLVSSEKQGSYAGSSTEPHEGPYADDGAVFDKDATKSSSGQAPVLEVRPDLTPTVSYVRPTSGDEPGNLAGQGVESPTVAQATYSEDLHNSASTQDIPANALGNFKKHGPHSAEQEAISSTPGQASDLDTQLDSTTGEVLPAANKFVSPDQDSVNSAQRPSSAEIRKEETVMAAAEQTLPTVIGQEDTQGMREAPTSDAKHALPGQKIAASVDSLNKLDQDLAHSTERPSSAEPINEEIKDPARLAESLFSALPDQTKKSTTVGQQDISPATGTSESPSSESLSVVESRKEESQPTIGQQDTQYAPGISKPMLDDDRDKKSISRNEQVYHYQRASEADEVSPPDVRDAKKITTPSQAKTSDPQGDSLQASGDVDPSNGHQSTTRSPPDQWAELPESTKSPLPLEASLYSESTQDVPKSSKLPSDAREVLSPTVVPAPAPDTRLGTASDKIAADEQNSFLPGQDLTRFAQPPFSDEPTEEATTVAASDQTNDGRTITGEQASMPATDKGKAPFSESYTQHALTKIQERTPNDDLIDESVPGQEQASLAEHVSEPRGRTTTDSHGVNVNESITTSPYSQEKLSEAGSDSGPSRPGIHPSTGDETTIRTMPKQGVQPPALNQDVSVGCSGKGKSTTQEVTTPTEILASALDTQPGSPRGEVGSSEHKDVITDVSSQPPLSVEPQKQERNVVAADQQHARQIIFDRQIVTPAPGAKKSSREGEKSTRDDLQASDLAKPLNVTQEQVPRAGSASEKREGPTLDADGAVVDEKVAFPSSQAQNSDTRPASTPINGDAQPARGDGPATSSLTVSQPQPPAGTQAPAEAISSPQIIQSVPADSLGKKEFAGPPSTDEEVMAPMTSPAPVQDAPQGTAGGEAILAEPKFSLQDQDSTQSARLSPPVESRKQVSSVAKSDQTSVSQPSDGPNVAPSAAETESARSLLPMTGIEPVQPPHEASFNLSSNKKTTMTQDDQSKTLSDVSFSGSQTVGQLESGADKGGLSEESILSYSQKNLEGTSTEEKTKQKQQTGLSSTQSSKDDNKDTDGTVSSMITSGGTQPLPPKENTESTEESRKQNKADQIVGQSSQDSEKQREETEARDTGSDEPEKTDLDENSGTYKGVQPLSKNTENVPKSTKGATSGIQTDYKSENGLRTSEESKQQVQAEYKTQDGETKAAASKTEQPKERDLPASSEGVASQSQAEASDESEEQTSSSIQKTGKNHSKLDSSNNETKSDDEEDKLSS